MGRRLPLSGASMSNEMVARSIRWQDIFAFSTAGGALLLVLDLK